MSLSLLQCVILTDAPLDLQLKVNQFCRAQDPVIKVLVHGYLVIQPFAVHVYLYTNHMNSVIVPMWHGALVAYTSSGCQYEMIMP